MTIDRDSLIAKFFFLALMLISMRGGDLQAITSTTTVMSFPEIKEKRGSELDKELTVKLFKGTEQPGYKDLNMREIATSELERLKKRIEDVKQKNAEWSVADGFLKKLEDPNHLERLQDKYEQLLIHILVNNLEHNPSEQVPVYFVIPRVIVDFREMFSEALHYLDPKVSSEIEKKFNRRVFKTGQKEYLQKLKKRYDLTYSKPRLGDKSLLGAVYPPGNTYYSQSYMAEAALSPMVDPYNLNSDVMFKFWIQESEFKDPFGILVRNLKRIFKRSSDQVRLKFQKSLMRLHENIDPDSKLYLVQMWIPIDQLDEVSHLEFFGHGFPVYADKNSKVHYTPKELPIYSEKDDLLSPEKYRDAFMKKDGKPAQYHEHPDLPKREKVERPIYPLRVQVDLKRFPYRLYDFPGANIEKYREELQGIINEILAALSEGNKKQEETPEGEKAKDKEQEKKKEGTSKLVSEPSGPKGKKKESVAQDLLSPGKGGASSAIKQAIGGVLGQQ